MVSCVQLVFIFFFNLILYHRGFPGGSSGKEPACQCRRRKRHRFDPWVRKILWRRAWQPTSVLLPGESHGPRSLVGCSPWGHKSQTQLKRLSTSYNGGVMRPYSLRICVWISVSLCLKLASETSQISASLGTVILLEKDF